MKTNNTEQHIQDTVLQKIREGAIRARPKSYFAMRLTATIFVAVCALIISIFVMSFVLFSLGESGEQFLLGFGYSGILTFLSLFPWMLVGIDIGVVIILEWLVKGFRFGYRISFLMIFIYLFAVSAILAVVVTFTPVHQALLEKADEGSLPVIGELYEHIRDPHTDKGVFRGTVTSVHGDQITLDHDDRDQDGDDGLRTIVLPPNSPSLYIGEHIYVFGEPESATTIRVQGISTLPQ
jgi:hypothetical protein